MKKILIISILICAILLTAFCTSCDNDRGVESEVHFSGYTLCRNFNFVEKDKVYENSYYIQNYSGEEENLTIISEAPDGLPITKIGKWAFSQNSAVKNIVIPDSVTTINSMAFYKCENLESVHIGKNVSSISQYEVFAYCNSLNSLTVDKENAVYYSAGNCIINKENTLVYGCNSSVIPEGIKTIGTCAFIYLETIEQIEIPDSVSSIEDWAFFGCSELKEMYIGENVKAIGDFAFLNCPNLTVYCSFESKPEKWSEVWAYSSEESAVKYPSPHIVWVKNE